MSPNDHGTIAVHVARAWSETELPQTQFAEWLRQLAAGYSVSPEAEAAAVTDGGQKLASNEREYVIASAACGPTSVFSREEAIDEAGRQLAEIDRLTDSPHKVRITSHPISDDHATDGRGAVQADDQLTTCPDCDRTGAPERIEATDCPHGDIGGPGP